MAKGFFLFGYNFIIGGYEPTVSLDNNPVRNALTKCWNQHYNNLVEPMMLEDIPSGRALMALQSWQITESQCEWDDPKDCYRNTFSANLCAQLFRYVCVGMELNDMELLCVCLFKRVSGGWKPLISIEIPIDSYLKVLVGESGRLVVGTSGDLGFGSDGCLVRFSSGRQLLVVQTDRRWHTKDCRVVVSKNKYGGEFRTGWIPWPKPPCLQPPKD